MLNSFDFFANYEYFEESFDHEEKLNLSKSENDINIRWRRKSKYRRVNNQPTSLLLGLVDAEYMHVDKEFYQKFDTHIRMDNVIKENSKFED